MPRYPKIACVKYETKQRETEKKKFALSGARTAVVLTARTTLNTAGWTEDIRVKHLSQG